MKISPIEIVKRALQLLFSNIVAVATFIILLSFFSSLPNLILMYINQGSTFSVIDNIIRFGVGLYIVPAIIRVFIKYLLARGSGTGFSKQTFVKEIQPDNSVRFMVLHLIVLLPVIAFWAISSHFIAQSGYVLLGIIPLLVAFLYVYSRLFLSEIVMTDLTEKIDYSLKKGFSLSKQYPINSMFVVVLLQVITVIHAPYIRWDLISRFIPTTNPIIIQVIISVVGSVVAALSYCVTTAFYLEIKKQKSTAANQ